MATVESSQSKMTKHLLTTGLSLVAAGYRTTRDVSWYVSRRLARAA